MGPVRNELSPDLLGLGSLWHFYLSLHWSLKLLLNAFHWKKGVYRKGEVYTAESYILKIWTEYAAL